MATNDVHVVPDGDNWKVTQEGRDPALAKAGTQAEADSLGRDTARRNEAEHNLHGQNGQVREKSSYGNDPGSSEG